MIGVPTKSLISAMASFIPRILRRPRAAHTAQSAGILGTLSSPGAETFGSAHVLCPATHALCIGTDRAKSAECPTNVKEVMARFGLDASRQRLIAKIERQRHSRVILLVHRQEQMSLLGFPVFRYI